MAVVSAHAATTAHFRYALPAIPYFFVWAGRVARAIPMQMRFLSVVVILCFAWVAVASVSIFPHGISYFNEFAGGPYGGHAHLVLNQA